MQEEDRKWQSHVYTQPLIRLQGVHFPRSSDESLSSPVGLNHRTSRMRTAGTEKSYGKVAWKKERDSQTDPKWCSGNRRSAKSPTPKVEPRLTTLIEPGVQPWALAVRPHNFVIKNLNIRLWDSFPPELGRKDQIRGVVSTGLGREAFMSSHVERDVHQS